MSFTATLVENTATVPSPAPVSDEFYEPSLDDPRDNQAIAPGSSDIPVDAPKTKVPEKKHEEKEPAKEAVNNGQIPAKEEPKKEEVKPEEKPRHAADMIEQAARLGISASEIEDMTPGELQRTVAHMHRFGQDVYNAAAAEHKKQPEPQKEAPKPKKYAHYDTEKNEAGYAPEILDLLREAQEARDSRESSSAEVKALKEEIAALKEAQQQTTAQTVQQRVASILTDIAPDAAKEFDPRTAKGRERYLELIDVMNLSYGHEKKANKFLDETERAKRALGVLGVQIKSKEEVAKATAETQKKEEMEKAKEKWDQGALGKDTSRKTGMTPLEIVKDIKTRAEAREAADRAARGTGAPPPPSEELDGFLP